MNVSISSQKTLHRLLELIRYYAIGAVNTMFGYGIYALFVFLGTGAYVAQLIGQIIGIAFNYFTYRHLVFRSTGHPYKRFIGAYIIQYCVSLALLALLLPLIRSEYWAGLATVIFASLINYFVLKRWVFRERK